MLVLLKQTKATYAIQRLTHQPLKHVAEQPRPPEYTSLKFNSLPSHMAKVYITPDCSDTPTIAYLRSKSFYTGKWSQEDSEPKTKQLGPILQIFFMLIYHSPHLNIPIYVKFMRMYQNYIEIVVTNTNYIFPYV